MLPSSGRSPRRPRPVSWWLPPQNRCWYAARIVAGRQQYGLTIDRREADALDRVLSGCTSTETIMFARGAVPAPAAPAAADSEAIAEWDDNGNGRITCAEARAHGIAPVTRDHPAYPFMRDGDGASVLRPETRECRFTAFDLWARGISNVVRCGWPQACSTRMLADGPAFVSSPIRSGLPRDGGHDGGSSRHSASRPTVVESERTPTLPRRCSFPMPTGNRWHSGH